MSGNDAAQRESTRDGRRGAARAEGGRAPEAPVLLFRGCPRRREPCGPARRLGGRPNGGGQAGRPGGPRRASAGPPVGRVYGPGQAPGPRGGLACGPSRNAGHTVRLCLWAEEKRQLGGSLPPGTPRPPPLCRAGVVGILCAGRFPARAAAGERIIPNSSPRRARPPRGEAPRGPRDGRQKLSEKSS